jgi:hypothetical protein
MLIGLRSLMRYFDKFEGPKKTREFKLIFKPLFLLGLIYDLLFDSISLLKYRTVKKNPIKSKKELMKMNRALQFLRKDLSYFILRL